MVESNREGRLSRQTTETPGSSLAAADLAELVSRRAAGLAKFDRWAQSHCSKRSAAAVIADIGALYALLPPEARRRDGLLP